MEASMGGFNLYRPAYVCRPETKTYLKKNNVLETEFLWGKDNKLNGYNAYSTPSTNVEKIYFGDWNKAIVGIWGDGLEVIINPFTGDTKGIIRLTCHAFVDTAVRNPKAFVIMDDTSTFYIFFPPTGIMIEGFCHNLPLLNILKNYPLPAV